MKPILIPFAIVGCFALSGCTSEEDYIKVVRDQRACWQEVIEIMETVQDQKSMDAAKKKLDVQIIEW